MYNISSRDRFSSGPGLPVQPSAGCRSCSHARQALDHTRQLHLQGRSVDGLPAGNHPVFAETIDLGPYINSSAVAVQETFSIERTYTVFRTMGLRHLVVVDRHNHVKGIVTRKVGTVHAKRILSRQPECKHGHRLTSRTFLCRTSWASN